MPHELERRGRRGSRSFEYPAVLLSFGSGFASGACGRGQGRSERGLSFCARTRSSSSCHLVMLPTVRPRYNQKGRAASIAAATDGSHNKRKREYEVDDSNAEIIDEEARKKKKEIVSCACAGIVLGSSFSVAVRSGAGWDEVEREGELLESANGRTVLEGWCRKEELLLGSTALWS